MLRRMRVSCLLIALILIVSLVPLEARVTRVEVGSRADLLGGKSFGEAGAYERISGKVYFTLSVANPHNQGIVDLGNAVNLKNGEVEVSADFIAFRPKDTRKGNGTMLLEVPNRGRPRILSLVDGGDLNVEHDAGDAWFLRNGYTVVSLGWQSDAAEGNPLRLYAPIAKENGKTITGMLRGDVTPPEGEDGDPAGSPDSWQCRGKRVPRGRSERSAQRAHGARLA